MDSLPQEDAWHWRAAQGWLELDNPEDAAEELTHISPQWLNSVPELLELRWRVGAARQQWEACERIAHRLTVRFPQHLNGWLLSAKALHGLGQTEEACELLMSALDQFPEEPKLPYELAVYSCSLGWFDDAHQWLELALTVSKSADFSLAVFRDPAFEPLWDKLTRMSDQLPE